MEAERFAAHFSRMLRVVSVTDAARKIRKAHADTTIVILQ
jgi:hypothetical protein